jgi:hypothetical protein
MRVQEVQQFRWNYICNVCRPTTYSTYRLSTFLLHFLHCFQVTVVKALIKSFFH